MCVFLLTNNIFRFCKYKAHKSIYKRIDSNILLLCRGYFKAQIECAFLSQTKKTFSLKGRNVFSVLLATVFLVINDERHASRISREFLPRNERFSWFLFVLFALPLSLSLSPFLSPSVSPSSSRAYLSSSLLRTESLLLALLDGDVAVAKWIRAHYRVSLNVAQSMEQYTLFTLPLNLRVLVDTHEVCVPYHAEQVALTS